MRQILILLMLSQYQAQLSEKIKQDLLYVPFWFVAIQYESWEFLNSSALLKDPIVGVWTEDIIIGL